MLVINLKRFKYDEQMDKMVKLFDSINYPFKLRLFNTTDDESLTDLLYELYALVIHIGGGPMHGHYVSLCKIKAGLWLLFDDETVELVEDSYVMRFFGNGPGLASAYILFYRQAKYDPEFGFNPEDIYNGNDDYSFKQTEDESSTLATSVNNDYLDTKSEASSIASFNVNEATKKTNVFKNFKFDKDDKPPAPISRSNSMNANLAPGAPIKEVKEKKSWVGNLKRMNTETSNSGNIPPMERKPSTSSTTSGNGNNTERRRSIFGFKRK